MPSDFILSRPTGGRCICRSSADQAADRRPAIGTAGYAIAIPSIRQLARDLQVGVITIKRAYLELEREG